MINVAIVGASGYTGLELVKILLHHPKFTITALINSEGNTKISQLHKSLQQVFECDIMAIDFDFLAKNTELVFLALPHQHSMKIAKELLSRNLKVVDLSADYRLNLDTYEQFYCKHEDQKNLNISAYGLPEFFESQIRKTQLIANPGCYPTATLLGLLPFMDYIADGSTIFIDAKSGVSGSGKSLTPTSHFVTINENMFAYKPFEHRHTPEIEEKITLLSNKKCNIVFIPHLISITRGMSVSIYATLEQKIENPTIYLRDFYRAKNFIRIYDNPVDIKTCSGTNFCDIFAASKEKSLFVSVCIDNLLRGASSQAVVNANLMFGFEDSLGIPDIAYVP